MVGARAYLQNGRIGEGLSELRTEVGRLMEHFSAAGATEVEPAALLAADLLIDLYGEDLRARAYTTHDPVEGERMLRPDFTVPVVQMHMAHGAEPARYAYAGPVWRRQEPGSDRPTEYLQVGYELFARDDPAAADAEVFALIASALEGVAVRAVTGDIGVILSAIDALRTNDRRKAALRRHVWRPRRFRKLLERYSGQDKPGAERQALLDAAKAGGVRNYIKTMAPVIGLRSAEEIAARAEVLLAETQEAPLSTEEVGLLQAILDLKDNLPDAAENLAALGMMGASENLLRRADALARRGVIVSELAFEASFGRTTLEYYDGFVFGFFSDRNDLPPIAQGGRYDALTHVIGGGEGIPAVGAIIRPEALVALKGGGSC